MFWFVFFLKQIRKPHIIQFHEDEVFFFILYSYFLFSIWTFIYQQGNLLLLKNKSKLEQTLLQTISLVFSRSFEGKKKLSLKRLNVQDL